jgi:alpha-galactosidase
MSDSAAIAAHDRAGCVQPTRLAARVGEATAEAPAESSPLEGEVPFRSGVSGVGPLELRIEVDAEGDVAQIDTRVRNPSDRPLWLESAVLGFRWSGHGVQALRFLRHGWQSWSYTGARVLDDAGEPPFPSGSWLRGLHHAVGAPPPDRAGWHESDLVTVIGASPAGPACLVGTLERGRAFGVVHARRAGEAVLVEVELRVDAMLGPGETRELERVRIALGADANELLEDFAEAHARLAGARASAPFVSGWCSWYHFFHDVSEADVLGNLEALVAARQELPIEVVQIDDGYQRATGDWLETNHRFPRGLAPLAEEIRAAGFTPGLWTAPFCAVAASALFQERRAWLLARGGEPFRGLIHPGWAEDGSVYVLDTSRPEVVAHLQGLFRELVDMGFAYLKLDFLYAAAMQADAADSSLSRAARLRRGLEVIRAGAGEETFLLGCGCPLGAAVGIVDGMRIGPDVAPSWRPDATFSIPGIEATLPSTRSALRSILARAWMHRRLWLNDPDCLMARADSDLSSAEVHTLASAIAAVGGMLFLSDDIRKLTSESFVLAGRALEAARRVDGLGLPGVARSVDLLGAEFATQVVAPSAERTTLAMINASDERAAWRLDPEVLGLGPLAGAPESPLESGSRLPEVDPSGCLEVVLGPHESALLELPHVFPLAVFCDFDGTFSVQDVGATLGERHAGRRPEVWARFVRGEITAWECNMAVLDGLALPRSEVDAFLRTVELDPGARDLVAWCERRRLPFRVLSDGFDANLNRLQEIHGVRFAYEANALRYERGRWRIRPRFPNPACECGTGACKRGRIEAFRAAHPGVILVHVGNGRVSDLCGALVADLAFAKDSLAVALEKLGHPFEPFETLHDVIPHLERRLAEASRVPASQEAR